MDSRQIGKILGTNRFTKKLFLGVFSSDNLPSKIKKYPSCFVANTDPHWKIGQHWVAFWINNPKNVEYFCSLGEKPNENMTKFLEKFKNVTIDNKKIQRPNEDTCGHFCIYFLISRASGYSYDEILLTLWKTRALADFLVKFFVQNHLMSNCTI